MSSIDIRYKIPRSTTIQFTSSNTFNSYACKVELSVHEDSINLCDFGGSNTGNIRMVDIDNLILALRKAKEMWVVHGTP